MIIGISMSDPFLVGIITLCMPLGLILIRVRVGFAAAIVGPLGLLSCADGGQRRASSARFRIRNP
ncbi:MAG: hypothetical protein ACI86S_000390 [Paracoccaceae bacterium]|jgi:hypothetical protein